LAYRRTMWLLAWYYLNGARRFDVFDPAMGLIKAFHLDGEGNLEFQSQELMSALDRIQARLASMDFRPKVMRQGLSLAGIRQRAIGQIIADSVVSDDQLEMVKTQFAHIFTVLGSCGIAGNVIDHPIVGLTCDLEVVHPREMMPFPSQTSDYTKERGKMRQRIVPLLFLKEVFGRRIMDNLEKLEWWEQQSGEPLGPEGESMAIGGLTYNAGAGSMQGANGDSSESKNKDMMGVAQVRELWLDGQRGTCARYIITCGDYLIADEVYDRQEVYCPIGWARFMESGTFHGIGAFDLLFSISRELEKLLKSLFNNIRDIDRYGYIVMPSGSWNERAALKEVGKGLRVIPYEPDPVAEGFRPFPVQPYNSGDVPGKVATLAKELMTAINPVQDLIQEKGRVDSGAGLQFLDEQINRALTSPSRGVDMAWSQMYRSAVHNAARELKLSPRPLSVGKLTLELAGAVIGPDGETVSFPENPLPTVSTMTFGLRERSPRSEVARKDEAMNLYMADSPAGPLMDPDGFRLFALKEGLDFAMWMDEWQAPYETVVRNCLLLYGDGETPGEVVVTPATAKPEFQMRVLVAFMSGPAMAAASPDVQDAFASYRDFLMGAMGLVLPAAVPNPDDMSMLRQGIADQGFPVGESPDALPEGQDAGMDPAMMQQ